MNKKAVIGIIFVSFFFISLISCKPPQGGEQEQSETFGLALVKVMEVKRQRISEKLFFTGVIEAWQTVNVTPEVGGKIARIYVEEGDSVGKGQLLAELDTRAIQLQVDQAKAALAVAQANYNDAEKNMERMERLRKEKAVSEQQYEKIRLAYDAAEAELQRANAALNLAKYNLDVSILKAPFNGVVASKNAEVGDVINPMMGSFSTTSGVLTLVDYSRVKIQIDVSYEDIVRIHKGQTAYLTVDTFPGKNFEGKVSVVNKAADPVSKKFQVEVTADNPERLLRPNTFGEIMIEVRSHEDAIAVPQKAVLENSHVFVVNADNTVTKKEVTLGLQNTDLVEVTTGLESGEIVVVEGNYGLADGEKIQISEGVQ
ncbi:MAG: efflux RND transporter periplasmic adaptor subunit [Candidatus Aminicenantes bacterium]|nr:efflux RND transporter periplasmic adaptor subunit [Candidatus Aminicenantes bacterium]